MFQRFRDLKKVEKDWFKGFEQAKFAYGCSILGSSEYTPLSQLPLKMTLDLKGGQNRLENNHIALLI